MRHSVTFYVLDMSTCGTHSTTQPTAQLNNVSLRLLVFVPNIAGLLGPGIKPGLPASQSDAVATALSVNLVTIEGGSHSTEMPNSCRTEVI